MGMLFKEASEWLLKPELLFEMFEKSNSIHVGG